MAKKKKETKAKSRSKTHTQPTSARLLKNRPPDDREPPETDVDLGEEAEGGENPEDEQLETPDKPKRRGRQARLPGADDPAIEELESLAEEYAEKRDERMAIGVEEVELKGKLLDAMKKWKPNGKYVHAGVFIEVVNSKDKVKVRISKGE
jgi:hypothetical protein